MVHARPIGDNESHGKHQRLRHRQIAATPKSRGPGVEEKVGIASSRRTDPSLHVFTRPGAFGALLRTIRYVGVQKNGSQIRHF